MKFLKNSVAFFDCEYLLLKPKVFNMTIYIIVVTCIVSILALQNEDTMRKLIFNSAAVSERGEWWRFITSGFVHANWMHLAVNMFVLYSFGQGVESVYNHIFDAGAAYKFLILYFGGMVVAMIPSYKDHEHDPNYNSLGASGAVSAILFAYVLYAPLQNVCLYGLLCFPGVIMGGAYLAYTYYASKKGQGNINHSAHLWGALFGMAYTLVLKPELFSRFFFQISDALHR
jgi:membrane associated rhomboid family serine protease